MFLIKIIFNFIENLIFLLLFGLTILLTIVSSSFFLSLTLSLGLYAFNISFSHLEGNLFSGISVDNLSINNKIVSKNIDIEWDLSIIKDVRNIQDIKNIKEIKINHLNIDKLNKDNLLELISSFDNNNTTEDSNSTFDMKLILLHSHITIDKLIENNITIYDSEILLKNLSFDKNIISTSYLNIKTKVNIKNTLIDIKSSSHSLTYNLDNSFLDINSTLNIDTNYSKNTEINSILNLDTKLLNFRGSLKLDNIILKDNLSQYNKYIDNLNIDYGKHKTDIKIDINSPLINLNANIDNKKIINAKCKIDIPKKSKIKNLNKDIIWKNISKIDLDADINLDEKVLKLKLNSKYIKLKGYFNLLTTNLYGKLTVDRVNLDVNGKADDTIYFNKNIDLYKLISSVDKIYKIKQKEQIKGNVNIKAKLKNLKNLDIDINSNKILYKNSKKDKLIFKDIFLSLSATPTDITLKKYQISYDKFDFYSNQTSYLTKYQDRYMVHPLIINDDIEIMLDYNMTTKNGDLNLTSTNFSVLQEIINTNVKSSIVGTIKDNKIDIKGDISILNGDIFYNLNRKRFSSSRDIIIVQNNKKKDTNFFRDDISLNLSVNTKKPLVYNKKDINLKLNTDLQVYKALKGTTAITGIVEIAENGFYIIKNKKFKFKNSKLYFIGDTAYTILDLKLEYKNSNYIIKISVRGDASNPIITFSSNANLSQAEILSVILFDSSSGGDSSDTTELIKMIGGALAKSILANVGIKLDYLVFGANNRVEVGKEIVKGITIIYVNDEVSSVKLQYKNNSFTTTTVKVNNESQSIDIIFKKRFDKF